MDEVITKFDFYLDNYYQQILKQIELNKVFKNFLATMDLKFLYPLLDENNILDEEFIKILSSLKKINESDHFDYYLYDDLISKLISFDYFKDLNIKSKYLMEQKDNYELKLFDYSFLTKFMLDRNFSISEINYVLSNYKPNKKEDIEIKDNTFKKQIINSKIYIECSNFLINNEKLIKSFQKKPDYFELFKFASVFLTDDYYKYSEPIFIMHYLSISNKKKQIDNIIEKELDVNEKNYVFNLLFEIKKQLEKANSLDIINYYTNKCKKNIIFIEENNEIPNDIIENLSIGLFDYKARKHPLKLMNIIDYIVRINSNDTYAVSFIENEDDVIILTYDKKDKIVDKTSEFIKLHTDKINTILGREKYER